MRLNILQRGGGRAGWILMCSLLLGTTLGMGMGMGMETQLYKREPQQVPPSPSPPVTVWVTVTTHGGWTVTEFSTTTITQTPIDFPKPTSTITVTSTAAVTSTVTVQSTTTQTATRTTTAAGTAVITSFAAAPTTTTDQGAQVVRRQAPGTVTSTTTLWDWAAVTTTSIITVTVQATPGPSNILVQTSTASLTATLTTTQVRTFTTEQTVTASTSPSIIVDGADPANFQSKISTAKAPSVGTIVGASFGALIGFIGIFVLAYLWAKKRRDDNLRNESAGFSSGNFSRSMPAAGAGVIGIFGSLRRGSSTARYNNLPTTEATPNMPARSLPPQSHPPQLPSLRVNPPSGEFNYDYTFGSPVSSIDEAQLHASTSGSTISRMNTPPTESPAGLLYNLSRQSEEPPWRTGTAVAETVVADTIVSSMSAESERVGSLRTKPLPGDDLVSP